MSGLFTYPVKSLKGISNNEFTVDAFGFAYDRRFMFVDDNNKFVTQRTHPKLSLISARLLLGSDNLAEALELTVHDSGVLPQSQTVFPMTLFEEGVSNFCEVSVWSDVVSSKVLDPIYTKKISDFLGVRVRLSFMPDSSFRQIDREFFSEDKRVSFADGYPFLLTSEASLTDLNSRLEQPVSMRNFRPNIVISGGVSAYAEDVWQRVVIGDITFELVKPCSRCIMTTVNDRGIKSDNREPLKTLSQYRRNEFGICFGQNLVHLTQGTIRVGDLVSFE